MAPLCYNQSPAFTQQFQKKVPLFSATTNEKYIICKDYCIPHHNDKTCFLPSCKYHILLPGNVEEPLKKLDTICFTYQHVDCLYTLFKYRFSGKFLQRADKCLITYNEPLTLIKETREWVECRVLPKRGS